MKKHKNQRWTVFMDKGYLLQTKGCYLSYHEMQFLTAKAVSKLMTPVLCMHVILGSLYHRTYILGRYGDQRKEQTKQNSHPLTVVKEKIKPSTGMQPNTLPTRFCFIFSRKCKNFKGNIWKYDSYTFSGHKMKNQKYTKKEILTEFVSFSYWHSTAHSKVLKSQIQSKSSTAYLVLTQDHHFNGHQEEHILSRYPLVSDM